MSASKGTIQLHVAKKDYTPENRDRAEEKVLNWKGVQTRNTFTQREEEVTEWIQQIIQIRIDAKDTNELTNKLCDGIILYRLIQVLNGSNTSDPIPDNEEDRVDYFLEHCEKLGVSTNILFDPLDLIQKKNMVAVVFCLHSLAEVCHKKRLAPFFTGQQNERKNKKEEWKKSKDDHEGWMIPHVALETPGGDGAGLGISLDSEKKQEKAPIVVELDEAPVFDVVSTTRTTVTTTAPIVQQQPKSTPLFSRFFNRSSSTASDSTPKVATNNGNHVKVGSNGNNSVANHAATTNGGSLRSHIKSPVPLNSFFSADITLAKISLLYVFCIALWTLSWLNTETKYYVLNKE